MSDNTSFMTSTVSPGNVPVYHGRPTNPMALERRLKLAELLLRVLICGSSALAAFIIATNSQVREIFTIQKKAKFTEMKALVFLVVTNGILASYSLAQLVRCALSMSKGSILFNRPLAMAIFSGDQLMAYLSLAAVAASLESSALAKLGQSELQWMKICGLFEKYCNEGAGGVACAVLASLCAALLSSISAYSLFRLFGRNDGKSNGSW
nr:CASP-like protein [Fagopyrum tataricum]